MQEREAVINFKQCEMVNSAAIIFSQTERGMFTVKQRMDGKRGVVLVGIIAEI